MTHVPVCRIIIIKVEQGAHLNLSRFRHSQKKTFFFKFGFWFGLGYFINLFI